MSGQRLNIPTVGLLICIAQLVAIARQQYWPPLASAPREMAAIWHSGALTYIVVSGLLRVSLLVLIRATSASTLQLLNALAVPFGAAFFTSGFQSNFQALMLGTGGAVLYLLGQREQALNYLLGQQQQVEPIRPVAKEEIKVTAVQEEPTTQVAEVEVLTDKAEENIPKIPKKESSWMDSIIDATAVFQDKKPEMEENPPEQKDATGKAISKSSSRQLVNNLAVPLGAAILTTSGIGQALLVVSGACYMMGQREATKREKGTEIKSAKKKEAKEETSVNTEESSTEAADQQQA